MEAIYSDYYPIFIYVDKYRFSKNWVYPSAPVPYSLIRYVVSGTAVFSLDDTSYEVGPGDTLLKQNDIPHGCVYLEAGVLLDIFTPMRKDFV